METSQKYNNPFTDLEIVNAYVNYCDFTENKNHGIYINKVLTTINETAFLGNLGYAIHIPS